MTNFYDMTSFDNCVDVSRARLLDGWVGFNFFLARDLTATEVRSILATRVVLW